MMFTKIGVLTLNIIDRNNRNELEFIKKLCKDETITSRFQGITLDLSNIEKKEFFDHSFIVKHNENYVGYIKIGAYNEDEKSVYLRAAIDKDKRGYSYGKTLLDEITEYIFKNYLKVESIRLKIASDNKPSLMTANACGYEWLRDDFYIKTNPYINKKTR